MSESSHIPANNPNDPNADREQPHAQPTDGNKPKQDPLIGQHLTDDYLILDRLGAGGMAIVYKARHLKTDRIVAVKTLRERDPAIMERFYREVQTLAKLKHKNIVEALDCIRTDSHHTFLVMEFVEGITLDSLIRSQGRVEKAEDIASILSQVCDALEHAHQQRIIHRDLKPANIVMMVDEFSDITAKVLDFGIAKLQDDLQKLTSEGQALGSPLYMSPEQCMGLEITPASDVYSLGILSYQLITGELPYRSTKMLEIMSSHCNPDVWPQPIYEVRPDLPGVHQLNQIIFRALSTKIEERFQSVAEFGKAITFWIQSTGDGAAPAAKMAKAVTSNARDDKTKVLHEVGVRHHIPGAKKPSAPTVPISQQKIALLKLASFLIVAIALTSGLSLFLISKKHTFSLAFITDGFVNASRNVSNVLAPVKPKETVVEEEKVEQSRPNTPEFDEANNPFNQRKVDENASAPIEITGDSQPAPAPDSNVRRLTREAE